MSKTTKLRQEEIIKMVLSENEVKVKELALYFNVSMETIRKDLNYLDTLGMVEKTHGGAKIINDYYQLPVNVKLQENVEVKRCIARKALDLIDDNSVVFLDAGSTTIQLAKLLKIKKGLTIVTNSIVVADIALESNQDVICTGGIAQKRGKCLVGLFASNVIDAIHIDTMITGSDGFKGMQGPSTFSLEEAEIRSHVIKNSDRKVLICDASKFSKTSTYQFAKFEDYDYFVTNESDELEETILRKVKHVIKVKGV
ncbi:MAG: DeoR/GlpR transcriptional regulator [Erysipelotrichia bacterium]|nr:DeoR/GlpR transcriptional regulator [Erysipelotrichia bacterium]NCC54219.1 DeoR/GlpR transcriptional regulator [Erysipelotrichia bacterium]